ncbi:MAG: hypothetical protein ACJ76P_05590 [Actinomycetota bacterium]
MRSLRLAVSGIALAALVLGSLAVAAPAGAAVDCSVRNKSRGGSYTDLQAAIDDAHSGDVLHVKGTCSGTFDVDKSLRVRGGSTNRATLDGAESGTTITVEQFVTLKLAYVVVTGGNANGDGGGIDNIGTLRIKDSDISNNEASAEGGGIFNEGAGTVNARNVTVDNNVAGQAGGGIANEAGTVNLNQVTLRGNSAIVVATGILRGTSVGTAGGALFNADNGTMNIQNSTVGKNARSNEADDGGGLFAESGTTTILGAKIHHNVAAHDGGGIFVDQAATVNIQDSAVTFNNAGPSPSGGGVFDCGQFNPLTTTIANNDPDQVVICA